MSPCAQLVFTRIRCSRSTVVRFHNNNNKVYYTRRAVVNIRHETTPQSLTRGNMLCLKIQIGANSLTLTLTLDLLNPKSVGFHTAVTTTTVSSFKSLRSKVFVLSC